MCGRYYVDDETERDIERLMKLMDQGQLIERFGDINPGQMAMTLTAEGPRQMRWGFTGRGRLLINARAETVLERPTFATHIQQRRCLLPAAGFYEWDSAKEKVTCTAEHNGTILMAGFYRTEEDGPHFIIVTTAANDSMRRIHDRMPLILSEEEAISWLHGGTSFIHLLDKIPDPVTTFRAYEQQSLL